MLTGGGCSAESSNNPDSDTFQLIDSHRSDVGTWRCVAKDPNDDDWPIVKATAIGCKIFP